MSAQQSDQVIHLWKIMISGDSQVGKTSIITRLVERTFHNSMLPTIGVDFHIRFMNVDGVTHKLQLWDVAGGERIMTIMGSYYRGCTAVILVYDITNRESFDNLIDNWIMFYRMNTANAGHKVVLVIVGSKSDLHGQCQVFREEAEAYARSIGALFYETSARTGENVDLLFEQMIRRIVTDIIPTYKIRKQEDKKKEKSCTLS